MVFPSLLVSARLCCAVLCVGLVLSFAFLFWGLLLRSCCVYVCEGERVGGRWVGCLFVHTYIVRVRLGYDGGRIRGGEGNGLWRAG